MKKNENKKTRRRRWRGGRTAPSSSTLAVERAGQGGGGQGGGSGGGGARRSTRWRIWRRVRWGSARRRRSTDPAAAVAVSGFRGRRPEGRRRRSDLPSPEEARRLRKGKSGVGKEKEGEGRAWTSTVSHNSRSTSYSAWGCVRWKEGGHGKKQRTTGQQVEE